MKSIRSLHDADTTDKELNDNEQEEFTPSEFANDFFLKLEPFINEQYSLPINEITVFDKWGIPDEAKFPVDEAGKPRPFTLDEANVIMTDIARNLGYEQVPPEVTQFFDKASGSYAYQMRNYLRDEVWLRKTMLELYPDNTLIPLARDGIFMVLREYFENKSTQKQLPGSLYYPGFQFNDVGNFEKTEQIHAVIADQVEAAMGSSIKESLAGSNIPSTIETIFGGHKLNNVYDQNIVTDMAIDKLNDYLDKHPEEEQFLQTFLSGQINLLPLEENAKVVLYDTWASGKSLLTAAALLQRNRPDLDIKILISSAKMFHHDNEFYELSDINNDLFNTPNSPRETSWPFKFKGFNNANGLPEFICNKENLLEWAMDIIFAYNRSIIGNDSSIIMDLAAQSDIRDILPPQFLKYVFIN